MTTASVAPLAERMRPHTLDSYVGQQHILGKDQPLLRAIERGELHSCILWGPPGTGKTTLADIMAHHAQAQLIKLSAIDAGVKDIRQALVQAKQTATVVFVDEVHRFNKAQQDAFLPAIESGLITFIGATTENPSFSCNNALLSRTRVYVLEALTQLDIRTLLLRALHTDIILSKHALSLEESAMEAILHVANGDARKALLCLELSAVGKRSSSVIELDDVQAAAGVAIPNFDKDGDHYYDMLSAFHKSVRGSSSDGALYWFARFLQASTDPTPIMRRLLAIASEDIGLADPKALSLCLDAWDTYHRVGAAEGERAIAQACVYCALAPKSNALYTAFKQAKRVAADSANAQVPTHLRNAPTALARQQGHGNEYRYAHNEPNAYSPGQTYLPEGVEGDFYQPNDRGLEKKLSEKLAYLEYLDTQGKTS